MTYIRVIFKGSAYGPINVPAKMGEIVTAMRVSPRAIPCLVKLDVNNGQHLRRETAAILDKSAGGLHYDINPASSVSSSSTSLTENSKQFKDTPAIVISQMQENVREGLYELVVAHDDLIEMDGDDEDNFQSAREAAAAGHDASKRQWKPSKVAAVQTDNFTTDEWNPHRHQQQQQQQQRYFSLEGREELTDTDLPMSIKEMEISLQAMTQVIASIPARYIRYNAVLSKNLDRAMAEVNRLQQAIDGMPETENTSFTNNTTTAMTFGGLGEDVGKKKQLGPVTTSVLKPNHRKALIFYHMMDVLLSVWQSVWIKFGPSMRQYHAANSKSLEAVEQAEHFLNVFHMWRKTMDMGKLEAIQKDGTFQYKTFLSRKNRYQPPNLYIARPFNPLKPILSVGPFQKATPAGVDIFALKSSTSPRNIVKSTATNSVAVYEASASMTLSHSVPSSSTTLPSTKLKSTNSIDKRMLNLVGKSPCSLTDREILQKFRKSYVTALVQTGAYKDKDMDSLLEELLSIQGPELFDENLIEDYKFPTHFIRTQIRREFKLNSWKQSVMEADSSTTSARSHHKQAKTPLAATATTTTTAVQTEASGRVMYASSKKKVMLTTGNNNGVLSASTESLGRIMSQSDAYRIKTKSMASFMDSSTSLANLTKSGVDLHFNLMNENRPPSQLSIYGRQESIVSSPTSLQQ